MAKAYLICSSERFNKNDFLIPIQEELLENEGESEVSIKLHQENFHLEFDQYLCHNDFIHNTRGRVFNRDFNYYIEPISFYSYYRKSEDLLFVQTKTKVALDFITRMNNTKKYILNPVNINFNKIIPHITEVAGVWIADLKKINLKTAGYFGPNVHRSEEYKEAAAEGNVSSIHIKYISDNNSREYYVVISGKGSIILYDSFETLEEEINLVNEIYHKFIYPHM